MKKRNVIALLTLAAATGFAAPQTMCPVMKGNKVSPKLHVDVEGYRIYVCCGGCVDAIKKNPSKYIKQMQDAGVELEKSPQK